MEASCGVLRFHGPALGRAGGLFRDAPAGPAPGWSGAPEETGGRGGWATTAGEAEPLALGTSPTRREAVAPVRTAAATQDADGPAVPGDEQGFAAVVRKHQGMVHAIAWHFLHDYAAAEDLAQDVFLSLYAHRDEIASPQHLVNWLRQVASRKCLDRRRRRTPEPLPAELTAPDSAGPAGAGDPWQKARLRRLLAQVPAQPRMVLLLRYQQELGIEEIAAALAMPAATVRSHLRRSLARLRRQWRKAAQGARS
jgi:RNA polymerase sigma factor (sigma-70 family)